ncbi:MFS transporter [Roseateles depolymerans]|uniref:Major facilitator superfamily MFS_1 n=1 Tax=Roseateles depolymerans TaxID=76731 RepID=A0A0U3L9Q9_9BURK|nr:MFS transporter [Roseateles depolymerans]ALV08062.1 Major facilitator superfamily MFS_1 [Roseateles depolymerans]REG21717.1 putative MFS family arabinose efflux permease [Roseateles depolymerans]
MATASAVSTSAPMTKEEKKVIFASSLGTVFEWYDFYLYGSLAAIIGKQFFTGLDPTAQFIASLMAFAAGFIVRPFGALVFGRLGDMIGRKYTFLVTILIMGLSTFIVGVLPTYDTIGPAAAVILVGLRLLQGLALGGEYGGAATYVAEHAPHGKRGAYTSWIQTTATLGLFLSLIVILSTRTLLGEATFAAWGWRIPFVVSILLLGISVWIRLSMNESPAFQKMKSEGKTSKAPLSESFGQWKNLKIVLLALFGLVAGQGVVGYTGQFYALFFMTSVLKVEAASANIMVAVALLIGTPFFVIFGTLSDKIGRKPIIMAGLLLAILTYFPLFKALTNAANPDLARAQATAQITLTTDLNQCSFQGSPVARDVDFTTPCDIAKRALAQAAATYETVAGGTAGAGQVKVGDRVIEVPTATLTAGGHKFDEDSAKKIAAFKKELGDAMKAAGYPTKADPAKVNTALTVAILTLLVLYVTMVYGPIAAMLVELFPTRIRYTSMSLPYHIGNGWFGGLLPSISFAMVAQNGNIYHGLWYPIGIAALTLVIGLLFVRETKDVDIYARD